MPESGGNAPRPERLQWLLDGRRVREQSFSTPAIVAIWRKAVDSARDAQLPGMSLDGALRAAYDAGYIGALAVLAAHGLRPASGQGHHEATFAAVAALGRADLEDIVVDSSEIRALRAGSMYDPVIATEVDRQHALQWATDVLPTLRAAAVASDPAFATLLAQP